MKPRSLAKIALVAVAAAVVLAGCKDSGPSTRIFVKNGQQRRIRVAVLQFDNVSNNQDAGRIITSTVVTYLLSTGEFDGVEPGVVYSALQAESVRLADGVDIEICRKLQPKLNADALIVGLVEEFGEVRLVDYRKVSAAPKFVGHYHAGEEPGVFESLPAYAGDSAFAYHHLDVAVGRFRLFVRGPKDLKGDIESLTRGIIALLR